MMEQSSKPVNKNSKFLESRKSAFTPSNTTGKRQSRKRENPIHFKPTVEQPSACVTPTLEICKNVVCRAVKAMGDKFCKRCSCCICSRFDDNKDTSLWLVCESEFGSGYSCGLSCHVECAFKHEMVGVVKPGQYMGLDGSYCCPSCGNIFGILGCIKKQLEIAKDARRVNELCYRIYMSYKLLNGTVKFKNLHEIISRAKTKLEEAVGAINGDSEKMAHVIAGRLSTALDVHSLCSLAIDEVNNLLNGDTTMIPNDIAAVVAVDSPPASFRFLFEEVASSSLVIVLVDVSTPTIDSIIGFKLFYCKGEEEISPNEPLFTFPKEKTRIVVKNLEPSTEYTFRIVSYSEGGDLGNSEAKCFTKSLEVFTKENHSLMHQPNLSLGGLESSGSKMQEFEKLLQLSWANDQRCREDSSSADVEEVFRVTKDEESLKIDQSTLELNTGEASRELDLNVITVLDLNEELTPPLESPRDGNDDRDAEKNGLGLGQSTGNGPSDDSQALDLARNPNGDALGADSLIRNRRKRALSGKEEARDCDSALMNGSPFRALDGPGSLDGNFEDCVRIIRLLEFDGYIKQEFRLKFYTWFSLRSTEQERRVVNTFIQTFMNDPKSLAAQLVDTFSELISNKRPRNGFTSSPA